MIKRLLSLAIIIAACCFPVFSAAQESERIMVNQLLGDGSHGKVWRQWQHQAPEREVASVTAMLQKRSGGKDTFVNLRFGVDGAAFENGKQVFLPNNKPSTVTWNVSQRPSGKPFVLNVYKGEAFLSTVIVRYAQSAAALPPPSKPHAPGVRIGNVPPPAPDGRFTGTSSNRPRNYPDSRDAAHACRTMRNIRPPRI
ncbi:MAG TPA: hypothetical protein PLP17_08330, partial [Oligoflexia bacterium]|nr:hypothetical protein [Oligoflexia bacterium]